MRMISGTLDRSMVATFATSIVQVAKKPETKQPAGEKLHLHHAKTTFCHQN